MRTILLLRNGVALVAATIACGCTADRTPPAAHTDSTGQPAAAAATDTSLDGRWVTRSDSALQAMIPGMMYRADSAALKRVDSCDPEGDDHPPTLMAAVRARALSHDSAQVETSGDGAAVKEIRWRVELTSVAQLAPASAADRPTTPPADTAAANKEPYTASVGVRVDTLLVSLREDSTAAHRWQLCDVTGDIRDGSTGYWMFIDREPAWLRVTRWTPADASWQRVEALTDSIKAAAR